MGYKVVLSTLALEDLAQIVAYIAQNDAGAAERLGHRLLDQAETLSVTASCSTIKDGEFWEAEDSNHHQPICSSCPSRSGDSISAERSQLVALTRDRINALTETGNRRPGTHPPGVSN
jgi:hypothetical protein